MMGDEVMGVESSGNSGYEVLGGVSCGLVGTFKNLYVIHPLSLG
jgi:hypothetical protein